MTSRHLIVWDLDTVPDLATTARTHIIWLSLYLGGAKRCDFVASATSVDRLGWDRLDERIDWRPGSACLRAPAM